MDVDVIEPSDVPRAGRHTIDPGRTEPAAFIPRASGCSGRPKAISTMSATVGRVGAMQQRVSLITLGVADIGVARTFYERLGWLVGLDVEETVFFQVGGSIVGLWARDKLAQDCGVTDGGGWGGIALAHTWARPTRSTASSRRRGRPAHGSGGNRRRRSTAGTRASSSTRTAIRGRLHSTRGSSSATTVA
jgi:hypothetical protein